MIGTVCISSVAGIGTPWPMSQRSAWVRKDMMRISVIFTVSTIWSPVGADRERAALFIGVAAAQAVEEDGGEQQPADDDVDVVGTDRR